MWDGILSSLPQLPHLRLPELKKEVAKQVQELYVAGRSTFDVLDEWMNPSYKE